MNWRTAVLRKTYVTMQENIQRGKEEKKGNKRELAFLIVQDFI
jgi:hypothetical protein